MLACISSSTLVVAMPREFDQSFAPFVFNVDNGIVIFVVSYLLLVSRSDMLAYNLLLDFLLPCREHSFLTRSIPPQRLVLGFRRSRHLRTHDTIGRTRLHRARFHVKLLYQPLTRIEIMLLWLGSGGPSRILLAVGLGSDYLLLVAGGLGAIGLELQLYFLGGGARRLQSHLGHGSP